MSLYDQKRQKIAIWPIRRLLPLDGVAPLLNHLDHLLNLQRNIIQAYRYLGLWYRYFVLSIRCQQPQHNLTSGVVLGAVQKYVTLEGVREGVTVCDREMGGQEHVT